MHVINLFLFLELLFIREMEFQNRVEFPTSQAYFKIMISARNQSCDVAVWARGMLFTKCGIVHDKILT